MNTFKQQLTECMQNDPPPCASVCPFGLDIRDFIPKLARGAFGSAYRMYSNAVAFPGIVSRICPQPCQNACVFAANGGPISLRALEAAAVEYAPNPRPNHYNLPLKPFRIAVIGSGPSGLACALRLAAKKYQVVMFEREGRIGGCLHSLLPEEDFMPELERQFMYEQVEYRLGQTVTDLSHIQADAIYVATGADGLAYGRALSGTGALASDQPGVFLGGALIGHSPMEAIADGMTAASAIERFLKTGEMNEPLRDWSTRFHPDAALLPYTPPAAPEIEGHYTKEEAMAEAARCQRCQCDACVRYCDLMRSHHKYPKRIEDEVAITIQPVSLSRNATVATRLIATCNHCGLCKEVCPQSIDTGTFLLDSHRQMQEKGAMPWAYHEFWLRDMAFSNDEASLALNPSGSKAPSLLFFPGCRLCGSSPRLVTESYRAILSKEPDAAIFLSCCGAPAEWAGDQPLHTQAMEHFRSVWEEYGRPKVLFACMNCRLQFQTHQPDVQAASLYEFLLDHGLAQPGAGGQGLAAVFDPCSSRNFPEVQQAVRSLGQTADLQLEALPMEGHLAQCCGWGGQVELANPRYTAEVTQDRIAQSAAPYLVYCANCKDVFAKAGKPVAHILEALFPDGDSINWTSPPPTATQSRENRRSLKAQLLQKYAPEEVCSVDDHAKGAPLLITPDLLEKMDRSYLLREDVQAVVAHCEDTGKHLFKQEVNTRVGHMLVGNLTVWVEYRNLENCRELVNVYAHRMKIMDQQGMF